MPKYLSIFIFILSFIKISFAWAQDSAMKTNWIAVHNYCTALTIPVDVCEGDSFKCTKDYLKEDEVKYIKTPTGKDVNHAVRGFFFNAGSWGKPCYARPGQHVRIYPHNSGCKCFT